MFTISPELVSSFVDLNLIFKVTASRVKKPSNDIIFLYCLPFIFARVDPDVMPFVFAESHLGLVYLSAFPNMYFM